MLLLLLLSIYTNQAHICPQQGTLSYVSPPLGNLSRSPLGIRQMPLGLILQAGCQDHTFAWQLGRALALVLQRCRSEGRWAPDGWDQLAPGAAARCHGNGRILLSYSLLARTKPAASSSFAQHRDVQCIPSTPAFPLSPAGNPLQSMQGRISRSWSFLPLSHGWKTPGL